MTTAKEEQRQHVRTQERKNCILRLSCSNSNRREPVFVEILDHSEAGLSIIHDCKTLTVGRRLAVYIETLNISGKEAEVAWLKEINGDCAAGLKWV